MSEYMCVSVRDKTEMQGAYGPRLPTSSASILILPESFILGFTFPPTPAVSQHSHEGSLLCLSLLG